MLNLRGICPGIRNNNGNTPSFKLANKIRNFTIANIGTVFLKRNALHANGAARHINAIAQHKFNNITRRITGHIVVDTPTSKNNLRVITDLFSLVRQIIRIDTNAVPTNHSWTEWQKIPLTPRRLKNLQCIDV